MDITILINAYKDFKGTLHNEEKRSGLLEPVDYILRLKSKKVRPLLALIGYSLYRDSYEQCLNAAHGLEIFHNFTLMHDDIMDAASMRRGQASVHEKFGTNEAILSGDAMSIMAYQYLIKDCPDFNLRPLLGLFSRTAFDICVGQQLDMDFEKRTTVTSREYTEMIRLKTAVFLGMALQAGAMVAGESYEATTPLFSYGENLGIAFQIQDDLLDLTGNEQEVGKTTGGDILRKKKTILICKALEMAGQSQQKEILSLLHNNTLAGDIKIGRIKELFDSIGLFPAVEQEVKNYFALADRQLDGLLIDTGRKKLLQEVAGMLKQRKA